MPELSIVVAVAILGKPGFAYVKSRVLGFLRRHGPPARVGPTRYRVGLTLFALVLAFGLVEPYVSAFAPEYLRHRLACVIAGDALMLASLLVLGGEFWDKLRALFVREATVQFPLGDLAAR